MIEIVCNRCGKAFDVLDEFNPHFIRRTGCKFYIKDENKYRLEGFDVFDFCEKCSNDFYKFITSEDYTLEDYT